MFKQLGSIIAGIFIIIVTSNINHRYFARFSRSFLVLSVILLVCTIFAGETINVATRTLVIPFLGIRIQPSEVAKIAIIIYVAKILAMHQDDKEKMAKKFKPVIINTTIVTALILKDNLSTALLIFFVVLIMLYIGGMALKYIFGTIVVGISALALLILLASYIPFLERNATWISRIEQKFAPPEKQDKNLNYQATQAKIAVASGGILGKGPGNSVQRNFLPQSYSDFIYAIIAEEYGLWGALFILIAYFILLARIGTIVSKSNNTFPALMIIGFGVLFLTQALINMGVSVGVLPVTGQPLPMVSWGTTSMLCTSIALGAILSVSVIANMKKIAVEENEENNENEENENE